jgi:hypothetical protein
MLRYGMLTVVIGLATAASGVAQENGRILEVRPSMNVFRNGQKGMALQLDSQLNGLQNRTVLLRAVFFTAGGQPLLARPGFFQAPNGQVSVPLERTPPFPMTTFRNTELFMPFDELSLGIPGTYDLNLRVEIWHHNGGNWVPLDHTPMVPFRLIQK